MPRTDEITYQCPFCSHPPYKDVLWAMAHLEDKHPQQYGDLLADPNQAPAVDPWQGPIKPLPIEEIEKRYPSAKVAAGNLLHEPALVITYDATNLDELEEALGEYVRLTADGPQILTWFGEDFMEGWQPLADHSTVILFTEDAHPVQLSTAAAIGLGLREGDLPG